MFTADEKSHLAKVIEDALLELSHPEMPSEKPRFSLHVDGKESWSWADITPNWTHHPDNPNPWNEVAREVLKD